MESIKIESLREGETDSRGRFNLGVDYADSEVKLAVIAVEDGD